MIKKLSCTEVIYHSGSSEYISLYIERQEDINRASIKFASLLNGMKTLARNSNCDENIRLVSIIEQSRIQICEMLLNTGLGVFCTKNLFGFVELKTLDDSFMSIASSFHIKPLLRNRQSFLEYYILSVSGQAVKIFLSDSEELTLVETVIVEEMEKSKLEALQVKIIRDLLGKHFSQAQTPLILAGNKNTVSTLVTHIDYPYMLDDILTCSPEKVSTEYLIEKTLVIMERHQYALEQQVVDEMKFCYKAKKSLSNYEEILKAAVNGQVENLVIAKDYHLWGEIDKESLYVKYYDQQRNTRDDDLLDDLSEMVLKTKGKVWVMPKSKIEENLMATLRW